MKLFKLEGIIENTTQPFIGRFAEKKGVEYGS